MGVIKKKIVKEWIEVEDAKKIRVVLDPPRIHKGIINEQPEDYLDFEVEFTSKFQYDFFYDLVYDRIVMIEKFEDKNE